MQKVYLLLRSNQQTGPYSFEELLQLQLKPQDLIWVEGKSYGWRYPNEVEALKPYVGDAPEPETKETAVPESAESFAPATPIHNATINNPRPKNIFVSLPEKNFRQPSNGNGWQTIGNISDRSIPESPVYESAYQANYQHGFQPSPSQAAVDPIEQKAEELRKRAQAYMQKEEGAKTNYSRDLHEAEQDYTNWMFQQKTKRKSSRKKYLPVAGLCCLLAAGSWWIGGKFFSTSTKNTETTEVKSTNVAKEANVVTQQNSPAQINTTSDENSVVAMQVSNLKAEPAVKATVSKKKATKDQTTAKENEDLVKQSPSIPVESTTAAPEVDKTTQEENKVVTQAPSEKKKTIKEKLSELFKKKDDKAKEEPRGADNNSSGRNATRRDEQAQAPATIDVSDQVDIKTNKIADSWMIGVKNLKLTLYNQSDLTISAAKVEVLYYTEQNTAVDKKILSYNNIPPKKSQTVAAPDQRLADHIEYRVISATGVENAYATR